MTRPTPVSLADVVARLRADGLLVGAPSVDASLSGVTDDSRLVRAGDLFCAWAGTAADAHAYVPAAEAAGAAAALVERELGGVAIPQVLVTDGRRAAAVAAMVVYGDPAARLRLVGVTGTNGKSTTVWMLRHLLGARWNAASIGTLGVRRRDGSLVPGTENLTTPGPVELARLLAGLVADGVEAVAMEVSSHALDQGRVHALRFDAAVFTNLTRDHLDYHGTFEAYRAAKASLVERLRPDGVAVVNADDAAWRGVAERAPRAVRFGRGAEVRAASVVLRADGARFRLETPAGAADVHLPLLGGYNVENALAAAAAGLVLGLTASEIAVGLTTLPQVPGRLERIAERPCVVLRDYAHTPDALERVLEALRALSPGRLIVVFGAGGDRDRGKRPLMGAAAARAADVVIVTSDNPRTEDPDAIIADIEAGLDGRPHERITDRREAIARALEIARPDDIVLLAGKGHETYQVVGHERRHFDEREIVAELLAAGADA
ncbi:MAG: UDP-N-acetylmuramoyl-L-alanyl-D-glutamate--2,6-diaminopimelate ligase [Gemmatimonadetes bacterium]|nr:UDP-N-acetylmuramoyl-L-alanyl-D-glutamate--2,6-diaminopimelate ligase [Gemmatimonadota bacterium]